MEIVFDEYDFEGCEPAPERRTYDAQRFGSRAVPRRRQAPAGRRSRRQNAGPNGTAGVKGLNSPVDNRDKPPRPCRRARPPYLRATAPLPWQITMRFTPQFLDELRARLPVSEVVGRRVKLRKAGREWKGLSPFNQEKTPSFFVNDQKAMWFDFSSGKNGNIFDFLMLTEGVSFPEAVERLAGQAGVPLPVMTREAQAQEERRKTLHDIVELAAKFFETTLASRQRRPRPRLSARSRPCMPATQLKFRLGYAVADQYALKEHLGAAKIPVEDMVEAGLLVAGEDISVPYDRFRDRVMFPISDWRGRVIAFGGRALEKEVSAKYLNSPETPLFHKGGTLYNIAGRAQGRA